MHPPRFPYLRRLVGLVALALFLPLSARAQLVALWQFTNNSASQLDSSGNSNTATANGNAAWAFNGTRNSGVFSFDGNNDFLEAAHSTSLAVAGNITLAAWINVGNTIGGSSNWRGIVSKATAGADRPSSYLWFFNQGNLLPNLVRGNGSAQAGSVDDTPPAQNTWEHWAVTQSGTSVQWFRNGTLVGSTTLSVAQADGGGSLYIGMRQDGLIDYLGLLDDVAIFNTALDSTAINAIMGGDFTAYGVAPIPEPSTYAALTGLGAMLGAFHFRRRSKAKTG